MNKQSLFSRLFAFFVLSHSGFASYFFVEKSAQAALPAKDAVNLDLSSQELFQKGYLILNESDARKVEAPWRAIVEKDEAKLESLAPLLLNIESKLVQTNRTSIHNESDASTAANAILAVVRPTPLYQKLYETEQRILSIALTDTLLRYDKIQSGSMQLPFSRSWPEIKNLPIDKAFYKIWARRQRDHQAATRLRGVRVNLDGGSGWLSVMWMGKHNLNQVGARKKVEDALIDRFRFPGLLKQVEPHQGKIPKHNWHKLGYGLILHDRSKANMPKHTIPVSIMLFEQQSYQ